MAAPQQWFIRDVPKATFVNIATGKPMFYLTDLKTSGIENSGETVYARGGTGNAKLAGFSSNREAKINLESASFDNRAIALMTGNGLLTSSSPIWKREVLIVTTNAATLTYTPVSTTGALIAVFKMNADGTEGTELNFTASTVATGQYTHGSAKSLGFFSGDLANGSSIIVYYLTNTDATAQTITISSDKFAGSFKLILDAIVRGNDKIDYLAQYEFPTVKMEDSFSFSMASEGDPSVFTMPIEVLRPQNSTTMYTMKIFDGGLLT